MSFPEDGASLFTIDGEIRLKDGTSIQEFTKTGLEFKDCSALDSADFVIFTVGIGNARAEFKKTIGEELRSKLKPIWGLGSSGESKGVWRDTRVDNLWSMMGNL